MNKQNISEKEIKCPVCQKYLNFIWYKAHLKRKHNYTKLDAYNSYLYFFYPLLFESIELIIATYEKGYSFSSLNSYINNLIEKEKPENDYSEVLRDYFKIRGIALRSGKASHNTSDYINKYQNSIIEKYNVTNISQNKEVKEKKIKTMLKNYNRINNFCDSTIWGKAKARQEIVVKTKEFKENMKKSVFEKYGVLNVSQIPEVRKKISQAQIKNWKGLSFEEKDEKMRKFRGKNYGQSKAEVYIEEILNELKIKNISQFMIKRKYIDSYIEYNNKKIIIEFFGDYWHANPSKYKEDDVLKYPSGIFKRAMNVWNSDIKRFLEIKECFDIDYIYIIWEKEVRIKKKICKITLKKIIKNILKEIKEKDEKTNY